jgi:large subunit ribosomal protein L5
MTRLHDYYRKTVVPKLTADLGLKNPMQVPKITKITVNMGVGEAVADRKVVDAAAADMAKITGQKPLITKSKKAIASFKLRENLPIGCKVTLRGARMYEFLDRLITIAMPRIRDFRGVSARAFDGRGNYTLGVKEQIIFPGNPVRPDRPAAWHGHHHHHDGREQRTGSRAAGSIQLPVPQVTNGHRGKTAMAKTSMVQREKHRAKTVQKYAAKRAQLKELIRSPTHLRRGSRRGAGEVPEAAARRESDPRPQRCALTGRPRGVYRKFGLARTKIREVANRGEIPGLVKSSW